MARLGSSVLSSLLWLMAVVPLSCGGAGPSEGSELEPEPEIEPQRQVSAYEVDTPYVGDPDFWQRGDLFVMSPDLEPLDLWPEEVMRPGDHGIRIIVLLPGDYRNRSNGRLGPGILFIESSGTEAEPLLVTYASRVGSAILEDPHPAERFGSSEVRLLSVRIWNQNYQYFHGLTFANGVSACLMRETSGSVFDRCLWHETAPQPLRIRFGASHNVVQRCVMRRFLKDQWGQGDTVAIQISDGACTHNKIVSNVILNYTDSYQHTDRVGEDYGLGAGTILDNNFMGFTAEAYVQEAEGELMCGENSLDFKMGGTEAEPVLVTNNVFFGVRAARAGCGASGSGGYAVTVHRRGTWIEMRNNMFLDVDSGVFLNAFFLNVEPAQGRIDPHITITGNVFSGVRSFATAFPARTGRVMSGSSPALFRDNVIVESERLMEQEPFPGTGELVIEGNTVYGGLDVAPRTATELEGDGNLLHQGAETVPSVLHVPWVGRTLRYQAAPPE